MEMKNIKILGSTLIWLFIAVICCTMLVEDSLAESLFFSISAPGSVSNGASQPTLTLYQDQSITKIRTYHWNNGYGAFPGRIGIIDANSGSEIGTWNAVGEPDGGVPNAYWVAYPNVQLRAGTYRIVDSDAGTWSQNSGTGGVGFTWIFVP